jgi:hypothetical protein
MEEESIELLLEKSSVISIDEDETMAEYKRMEWLLKICFFQLFITLLCAIAMILLGFYISQCSTLSYPLIVMGMITLVLTLREANSEKHNSLPSSRTVCFDVITFCLWAASLAWTIYSFMISIDNHCIVHSLWRWTLGLTIVLASSMILCMLFLAMAYKISYKHVVEKK